MEAEKESVGLAVPFTAGIAAANYSSEIFCSHSDWLYAAASGSFALFAITWIICCLANGKAAVWKGGRGFALLGLRKGRMLVGGLFAAAGACICFMSILPTAAYPESGSSYLGGNGVAIASAAGHCAERLKELIDGLPFANGRCNALLKAFLVGDRSGIDRDLRAAFRNSGASHLLALSGMHMGIIYIILSKMLSPAGNSPLARKLRSCLIIAGAGFFTLMTGATPSASRAFLFILIREIAVIAGRKTDGASILCSALMLQLAFNPMVISSTSFQLSYLAMTGIFAVYPKLQKMWPEPERGKSFGATDGPMRKIWNMCALSISCQIFTGPLVWAKFGTFPQYFLLANLMCLPLMSVIMFSSAAVIALQAAGICPELFVRAAEFPIRALIFVTETIASM